MLAKTGDAGSVGDTEFDALWSLYIAELDARSFTEKEREKEGYRTRNFLGSADKYKRILVEVMAKHGFELVRGVDS